jgi:hypothetical protein
MEHLDDSTQRILIDKLLGSYPESAIELALQRLLLVLNHEPEKEEEDPERFDGMS